MLRMHIIGPDGQPINAAPEPRRAVPAAPPVASAALPLSGNGSRGPTLEGPPREILVPTRQPSTTIDALETEFARQKQRELAAASMPEGSAASQQYQHRTGAQVGRNDPSPCLAGHPYQNFHRTQ